MYNAGYRLWIEVANDVDTDRAAVDAKRLVVASIRTQYRMDSARTLNAVAASIEKAMVLHKVMVKARYLNTEREHLRDS